MFVLPFVGLAKLDTDKEYIADTDDKRLTSLTVNLKPNDFTVSNPTFKRSVRESNSI